MGSFRPAFDDGGETAPIPGRQPGMKGVRQLLQGGLWFRRRSNHVLGEGGGRAFRRQGGGLEIDADAHGDPEAAGRRSARLHQNARSFPPGDQQVIRPFHADQPRVDPAISEVGDGQSGDEGELRGLGGRPVRLQQQGRGEIARSGFPRTAPAAAAGCLLRGRDPHRTRGSGLGPTTGLGIGGVEAVVKLDLRTLRFQIRRGRTPRRRPPPTGRGRSGPPERPGM